MCVYTCLCVPLYACVQTKYITNIIHTHICIHRVCVPYVPTMSVLMSVSRLSWSTNNTSLPDLTQRNYLPVHFRCSVLSHEEKTQSMIEWWTLAHSLMVEYGLKQEHLEPMVRDANIDLRYVRTYVHVDLWTASVKHNAVAL